MLQVVCCCPVYQSQVPSVVCFFKHCDLHWAILTIGPRSNPVTSVVHQAKKRNHVISMFNKNHTSSVTYIHSLVHFLWSSLPSLKRTLDYSYTEIIECLIYPKESNKHKRSVLFVTNEQRNRFLFRRNFEQTATLRRSVPSLCSHAPHHWILARPYPLKAA